MRGKKEEKSITSFTVTKVSEAREQIHIFSNSVSKTVNMSLPFKLVIKNNAKVTMFWDLLYFLIDWWSLIQRYSPLSWADSLRSPVVLHERLAFYSAFFEYSPKWCTYSADMAGATWNCCRQSRRVLCTPYDHAQCHFMQSHIRKVHACLAVTCHLHFWQKNWDLLHATVVKRRRNK